MSDPPGDPSSPRLTPRERDVLIELCRPLAASGDAFTEPASIRQIADSLFVSEAAVKQHLARLYDKFEIYDDSGRRRVHLANAVMERGVLTRTDLLASSPSGEAPSQAVEEQLGPARAAAGGRDWTAAFDAFVAAESAGTELGAGDLELLGEAAMYIDRHPESIAARQRAHSIYLAAGDQRSAARVALALVINHAARLAPSVAGGWLNSARRLLEGCDDCPEQGYVVATTALFALLGGDAAAGRGYAQEAFAFGQRFDDADLRALGLALEGAALARLGEVADGLALLDEAMAGALAGVIGPLALGIVYCRTVCTCLDVFDYRRAQEWMDVIESSAAMLGTTGFPGDCRAHRAAVMIAHGEWAAGGEEALGACEESARFDLAHTGLATYSLAELHLRHGALDDAEEWFHRAHELGANPQPGLALVWMARGDDEGARSAVATALHEAESEPLVRARLLPVFVDAAVAGERLEEAQHAAAELGQIADRYGALALRAAASEAIGMVRLAGGDPAAAASHLAYARRSWREVDLPYDAARAGVRLARAHLALGDIPGASLELDAARRQFEFLGATLDVRDVAELQATAGA